MNRIILTGIVSKEPVLFLNAGADIKNASLKFSVVENYYKGKGRDQGTNYHNVTLFGEYAASMAHFITTGLPVQVDGHLTYNRTESTERKENGSPVKIYNDGSITGQVRFMNTPKKAIVATINKNIARLIAAGRMPQELSAIAEELYNPTNAKAPAFNYALVQATGMWGHARVWDKQKGGWVKSLPAAGTTNPVMPVSVDSAAAFMAQLTAMGFVIQPPAIAANAAVANADALGVAIDEQEQEHAVAELANGVNLDGVEEVGDILGD